ncbi:hypothetical protein Hanom_Chr04g00327771 [Helianthus anomalus]
MSPLRSNNHSHLNMFRRNQMAAPAKSNGGSGEHEWFRSTAPTMMIQENKARNVNEFFCT